MEDSEPLSLYQTFFDITVSLCERFHSLDPIRLRFYPACEVIRLMNRTVEYNQRNKKEKKKPKRIRKPAGDNWF